MTTAQAIEQVIKDAERREEFISSLELRARAEALIEANKEFQRRSREFDSLSAKRVQTTMKPITTLNALTAPVLRELVSSSAAEFLGEEFWLSLNSMSEKIVAKRVFNLMRERLTRGMC